jgi:hypothetical protein
MMIPRVRAIVATGAVLIASVAARAADHKISATYEFACTGNSTINLTLTSFNLPITSTATIAGTGGGAGAGKVTYGPLTIQFLATQTYANLLTAVENGQHLSACTLTETVVQGTGKDAKTFAVNTWNFSTLVVNGLTAIGSDSSNQNSGGTDLPTPLVQASFLFGTVVASN